MFCLDPNAVIVPLIVADANLMIYDGEFCVHAKCPRAGFLFMDRGNRLCDGKNLFDFVDELWGGTLQLPHLDSAYIVIQRGRVSIRDEGGRVLWSHALSEFPKKGIPLRPILVEVSEKAKARGGRRASARR